jgi:hypothetical protein
MDIFVIFHCNNRISTTNNTHIPDNKNPKLISTISACKVWTLKVPTVVLCAEIVGS